MKIEKAAKPLQGTPVIPGDKSISHRSVMFGAIAKGDTVIRGFLQADDCLSTISCFRQMGIDITQSNEEVIVHGKGLHGLSKPDKMLYTGNSGTTTRLISGILAGQTFDCAVTGDASIEKRPMKRIIYPLSQMGAKIASVRENDCAPLAISPGKLHGIAYQSPVSSAQVKSAVLLAGLYAEGITSVTEPVLSRNHTELMLKGFGADISSQNTTATLRPGNELYGQDISVPADISSAAFFIAAALLVPGSELLLKNIGINPTRDGFLRITKEMGANITLMNEHSEGGEPVADILVKHSRLHGVTISGSIIPTLIDEIPILCVLAAYAEGTTTITDAAELKFKESDRIAVMCDNLTAIGIKATATDDGMIIDGCEKILGGTVQSANDHRIAMSFAVAALNSENGIEINNPECISISYPNFFNTLKDLQ